LPIPYHTYMRETQRKGDIAVAHAISTFTSLDYDVALPLTESASYDILVDDSKNIFRVQVRYSSSKEVELRRIHSNSKGYVVKKSKINAYDWLYVYRPNGEEFLIKKCFDSRRALTVKDEYLIASYRKL